MPIEIRELIIKTEISDFSNKDNQKESMKELNAFKRKLMMELKKVMSTQQLRNSNKR